MTLRENAMDTVSATLTEEDAVESLEGKNVVSIDGEGSQISLRESLAAVRNSAQAAARIQAAFRVQSFCQRELTRYTEIEDDMMLPNLRRKIHRTRHFNDSLHAAAIRIQQKYRGWKCRKEFLKFRNRIVKIQAHVRGHQVRKQYKKVVWSVSIVEKAILRWRRKGSGLRGFRVEKATDGAVKDVEKTDEYEFLRLGRKQKVAGIEKALARVKSMVRYPDARDQYMRLVASSNKSKLLVAKSSDQLHNSK
ncbi:Calmodulin-binding transcription activator 2 [Apostasia shenzhenica]|uniref:Calmodulin-binding transcription activator 2 n=1 Tax=Apostasia shenzhenica TaxID=1088818 RepID=A0A2I0AGP2_9ASPA|nr:Calmodulin-binding transcription activator 2 [Apostasia shenzhenica]